MQAVVAEEPIRQLHLEVETHSMVEETEVRAAQQQPMEPTAKVAEAAVAATHRYPTHQVVEARG